METLSRVEAVVTGMTPDFVELQIAGSYETFQWPRAMINNTPQIGEKIVLELKNLAVATMPAREIKHDSSQQIKLLESLIN